MARFLLALAAWGAAGFFCAAQTTPMATPLPPAKPPAAPAAKPAPPVKLEDYFARYGKIISPNDQPPYPLKLTMPGPGFGTLHVPRPEELAMREKLEGLATLSDAQVRAELDKWPAFSKMSLGDQGAMLTRLQQFRDFRTKTALKKAHDLGLLTLNPQQQAKFEQEYWNRQLQLDRQLSDLFGPMLQGSEQKLNEDLFREFSSAKSQVPPPPKPPPPAKTPPAPKPGPAVAQH
jgi:hypothetical protein